jgi:hypothetical protein
MVSQAGPAAERVRQTARRAWVDTSPNGRTPMADSTPAGYGFADDPDEPRHAHPPHRADERPRPKKPKSAKRRDAAEGPPPTGQPSPAERKKPSPLVFLAVVAPLVGVAVFMAVRQARNRSAEQESFAAEMDKLVAPAAAGPVKATPGKVAIIDVDKRALHYLHERNGGDGADMQAATPREAVTVVQVRVTNKEVREYLNGRKGVKQTFHLTVIDKATWAKIDERSFEGGDPQESIRLRGGGGTNEPVTGPLPAKEIYSYLRGLCGG